MISISKYEREIKSNLNNRSEVLIHNLNQITSVDFNPKINLIDFEIFKHPTQFEIDIMMFSMDKEGNEVIDDKNEKSYFAGSKKILSQVKFYHDKTVLEDDEFLEKADETEEKEIIEWFISCWEKSICKNIKLPVYVCFHDSIRSYDLKNSVWIDTEDKYIQD